MFKLSRILVCIAVFLFAGCATTANYQRIINNWQGARAQDLVNTWGGPDAVVKLACGHSIYLYKRECIATVSQMAPAPAGYVNVGNTPILGHGFSEFSGKTTRLYCHTLFEVNNQGFILSSRFQGNNCVSSRTNGLVP